MADEDRRAESRTPLVGGLVEPLLELGLALGHRPVERRTVPAADALRPQARVDDDAAAIAQHRHEPLEEPSRALVVHLESARGVTVHQAIQLVALAGDGSVALRPWLGAAKRRGGAQQRAKQRFEAAGGAMHDIGGPVQSHLEPVQRGFQRVRVGEVGDERSHALATHGRDCFRVTGLAAGADQHVGSQTVRRLRDREPRAAGAAGDEDGPAGEIHRLSLSTDTFQDV